LVARDDAQALALNLIEPPSSEATLDLAARVVAVD